MNNIIIFPCKNCGSVLQFNNYNNKKEANNDR